MKTFNIVPALAGACLLLIAASCHAAPPESTFPPVTPKKFIQYGWDRPTPEFLRDHLTEMETHPFDGVVFRLPGDGGEVFNIDKWDDEKAEMQQQLPILSSLKWNKFTDNFLVIRATSTMDWFSDSDWKKVLSKVAFAAQAARAAHAKGIVFDPEPYGKNPWQYDKQIHTDEKTFADYSVKARQRGQQFMKVMQDNMPGLKFLMFYQYSLFYGVIKNSNDPELQKYQYGLMLPFLNGMLETADDNVQLIDGNEHSYSMINAEQFALAYKIMREPQNYVAADLQEKYRQHVRAGEAVYVDLLFGTRQKIDDFSKYMTAEEQMKWFKHNLYYALKYSDEYVWDYNEQIQWWRNRMMPPCIDDAIVDVKKKIAANEPLGFDVDEIVAKAKEKRLQAQQDKLPK